MPKPRPTRLALLAGATLAAGAAVGVGSASSSPTAQSAATRTVNVGDIYFVRSGARNPTVNVRRNDTVRFRWVGDLPHNVRVQRGPERFSSGQPKTSGTYSRRVRRAGTYRLFCQVHGAGQQSMTLRVR